MNISNLPQSIAYGVAAAALSAITAGCGSSNGLPVAPAIIGGPAFSGDVHGGQQPISGASVFLYAANPSAYSGASSNLLTATVLTDPTGHFSLTGHYTCTAGQQLYIVAIGGDPGAGNNPQAANMAALGDCSSLSTATFVAMDEVTTVGSVFALAPFMSGYSAVGSSGTNTAGLARAFASVKKLVDIGAGLAPGPLLAAGATAPVSTINTLADVLARCINSSGGVAGDGSVCGDLFALATPGGGTAPTDTIGLALAIARNPALNASSLFAYAVPQSPFSPRLTSAPTDWTLSITYTAFNAPQSTTIDANGDVYVANSGNNTVSVMSQTGALTDTLSGNGLSGPAAVAIDATGNAWVGNKGGSSVSAFTSGGGILGASPFTVGSAPSALAFDATGNLWAANFAGNSVTELNASGAFLQTVSSGISAPTAIAINPK